MKNKTNTAVKNITVIGTGYVGLVSGAIFAKWGHNVTCLDIDKQKIEDIKNFKMPIYEEGLEKLVRDVTNNDNFTASTNSEYAIAHGDFIFICVGTPSNNSGSADLNAVFNVAKSIAKYVKAGDFKIVVTKSTVPVGTNRKISNQINDELKKLNKKADITVLSNPEFLKEGTALHDAENLDRLVVGGDNLESIEKVVEIYGDIPKNILRTDLESAEMIKYASNSFLATKIAFINEISQICEKTGANVKQVARGMGLDSRIGDKFLNASIGFGGSCFPKDVEALYKTSYENLFDFKLLRGVLAANEKQSDYFLQKIYNIYGENLTGSSFGILGAAFKAGTDDVRRSVAIKIIKSLRGAGAVIKLYDPKAMHEAKIYMGNFNLEYCKKSQDVFNGVNSVIILTEWEQFKTLDYDVLIKNTKDSTIFDGRNILDKAKMEEQGIKYFGIGV